MQDIEYHDGKPVKVEVDPTAEIKNELHKDDQVKNDFDATKRELYADLPQAQAKKDRSLTARSLNTMIEGAADLPKTKAGLKAHIYSKVKTKGIFRDNYWNGYTQITKQIKDLGLEINSYPANDSQHSAGYSIDKKEKQWDFEITSPNGVKLKGYIKAQAAGSVRDPFDAYDMIFVIF